MDFDPTRPPTLQDLSPPYPDYPYYEGADGPAFEPDAADYSRANAWWLAEAALLAYGGRALADPLLGRPTLLRRDQVQLRSVDGPDDNGVLILYAEQFVLVAFRGTRVLGLNSPEAFLRSLRPNWTDVVTDARFRQAPFDAGGQVHEGFLAAFGQIEAGLRARLDALAGRPVWFTGHSLGGALATVAAARFGGAAGLYTFGSPRVGDGAFAALFDGRTCFRVVHHDDIVARIPPPLVPWPPAPSHYAHVGRLVYIGPDGAVRPDADAGEVTDLFAGTVNVADVFGGALTQVGDVLDVLTHPRPLVPLPQLPVPRSAVTDHAPLYYAWYLRRDLANGG